MHRQSVDAEAMEPAATEPASIQEMLLNLTARPNEVDGMALGQEPASQDETGNEVSASPTTAE